VICNLRHCQSQTIAKMSNTLDKSIIDIGGSRLTTTFDNQLPNAFRGKADFPKEMAYIKGMGHWNDIADQSYQTTDELEIIKCSVQRVVSELPDYSTIIDLGAANSTKFEPYIREFMRQGKVVHYVPLDLERDSLETQIQRAKKMFPDVRCYGLWGSFIDADSWYKNIKGGRLFLSMGSIFYNGPEDVVAARLQQFRHASIHAIRRG
jgi:Histidine-specific methyltransferase, SAM-dependent